MMRHHLKTDLHRDLSWFLIAYLLMLLSVLLAVHMLQPERSGPGSSSRSPVHKERQTTATPAGAPEAGEKARARQSSPRPSERRRRERPPIYERPHPAFDEAHGGEHRHLG